MEKKIKKFCFREPEFPSEAYAALLFVSAVEEEGVRFLYPMVSVYPSLAMLRSKVVQFKKSIDKENKLTVYGAVAIKINFKRNFPLRKEYWTNPESQTIEADYSRAKYLEMMGGTPQLYSILVVPRNYDGTTKKYSFTPWLPVLLTSSDETIDDLIKASDQPVDESAKSMGIYSVEFAKGIDLDTGELVEPRSVAKLEEANC